MSRTMAANASYAGTLSDASTELGAGPNLDRLGSIVGELLVATQETEKINRELEGQLADSQKQIAELKESLDSLRFESLTDELTTLANRKHFDQSLERAVANATETGGMLSLLITDIDNFKSFNDTAGHQAGDVCLKRVAGIIQGELRDYADDVFRFGGEEFVVLLRDVDLPMAIRISERIRKAVEDAAIPHPALDLGEVVTVSMGVASAILSREIRVGLVISAADSALYSAKRNGRNQVAPRLPIAEIVETAGRKVWAH
ncbi:MAG TPA: diguanylate cyclase [Hyphomicrobium sp.]|nr:diguanylate cyclase [Hyphomicrobium sp.]